MQSLCLLSWAKVSINPNIKAKAKLMMVKTKETGNPANIFGIELKASGASKKFGIEKYFNILHHLAI
ncbi:hypothetical protein NBRC111893_401 [Lentilactobacillus kosonis]|uniref:Uncharacterized protein n=1 Tax=Lentilactobacillus kosonis TaxID=2810561 RepID=A0A401FIQ9_9LACO|nr:hypothetical protein NBRC111893_401 [Lentilactobacillus kosonis]